MSVSKKKQKVDVLEVYLDERSKDRLVNKGMGGVGALTFEGLPPSAAARMMGGWPNIGPDDSQNYSPTAKDLVELAKKYGGTLGGYVIPEETGRKDARVGINSIFMSSEGSAERVNSILCKKPSRHGGTTTQCPDGVDHEHRIKGKLVSKLWWN